MCSGGAQSTIEFARQIRLAREAAGMSQRALGRGVGIDPSGITRIENGERDLRLSEAVNIADVLQIDIKQVFPGSAHPPRPARDQRIETHLRQALELLYPQQGDL